MRKRSRHKPKLVLTNPLSLLWPASKAQRDSVMLKFLTALHELSNGRHPGEEEWKTLSDAINTVEILATVFEKLDYKEVMPTVNAAIAGMVAASTRFKAGKGMRLDASGLKALRKVVSIYGQCLEALTEREMALAQQETQRRVNEILSGKHSQNYVVVSL